MKRSSAPEKLRRGAGFAGMNLVVKREEREEGYCGGLMWLVGDEGEGRDGLWLGLLDAARGLEGCWR